jgi:hypothetical protein
VDPAAPLSPPQQHGTAAISHRHAAAAAEASAADIHLAYQDSVGICAHHPGWNCLELDKEAALVRANSKNRNLKWKKDFFLDQDK